MFNECLYIWYKQSQPLRPYFLDQNNPQIFINEPTAQRAVSFWFLWLRLWVVTYESLKTKEKASWVIPKVVAVAYGSGRKEGFEWIRRHIGRYFWINKYFS